MSLGNYNYYKNTRWGTKEKQGPKIFFSSFLKLVLSPCFVWFKTIKQFSLSTLFFSEVIGSTFGFLTWFPSSNTWWRTLLESQRDGSSECFPKSPHFQIKLHILLNVRVLRVISCQWLFLTIFCCYPNAERKEPATTFIENSKLFYFL